MSRCFPFPPPGYEKKLRPDDTNLLIKEKHSEKKHKKEKKDKEKKERKEKKDKERREGKHREKKEKKNKHKDKKEKERDKEKKRIPEDKKVLGTSEHQNGGKPSPPAIQGNDSLPVFLLEQEKRLNSNNGTTESKMVGKRVAEDQGIVGFQGKVTKSNFDVLSDGKEKLEDKRDTHRRVNGQTVKVVARGSEIGVSPKVSGVAEDQGSVGFQGKVTKSSFDVLSDGKEKLEDKKDNRRRVNGQTLKVVARGSEIGVSPKVRGVAEDQGSVGFRGKVTKSSFDVLSDGKEKLEDKRDNHRRVNGQTLKVVASDSEIGVSPKVRGEDKKKVEGGVFQVENVNEKRIEQREKKKHKSRDGKGDKDRDRDQNKKNRSKDGKREKEKEEENAIEEKSKLQIKQSCINPADIHGNGPSYISSETSRSKGTLGKRKELETNGVLCDDDSRPSKLSRPISSSHQVMQNGSKHDPSQTAVQFALEKQVAVQNHNVNAKVSFSQSAIENGRKTDPGQIANGLMSDKKITVNNQKVQESLLLSSPVLATGRKLESCKAAVNPTNFAPGLVSNHKLDNNVSSSQLDVENQLMSIGSQVTNHATAERQGIVAPLKVNGNKHMINGPIKTEQSEKIKEKIKTHKRPPHPDLKYLSQILTVPQVEWSDSDDQEWLFGGSDSHSKKPRTVPTKIDETKLVWAEALPIESADIIALPYVLPY